MGLVVALLAIFVSSRIYRTLPVFFSFQIWCLCTGAAGMAVWRLPPHLYLRFFLVNMTGDDLFLLAILIELGRGILRHNRKTQARSFLAILLFVLAAVLISSLANWIVPAHATPLEKFYLILSQAFTIVRVAALLALVWWSSLRGLRWPNHELQIATGLGFYAVVALAAVIAHTHLSNGAKDHWIDQIQVLSYLGALSYWVLYFAKSEPKSEISVHKREIFC
jgi:hypothetical protein